MRLKEKLPDGGIVIMSIEEMVMIEKALILAVKHHSIGIIEMQKLMETYNEIQSFRAEIVIPDTGED